MFMIVHGIYEQKLKQVEASKKIIYRFIPRSYYDEQLGFDEVSMKTDMFEKESPWYDSTIGPISDIIQQESI